MNFPCIKAKYLDDQICATCKFGEDAECPLLKLDNSLPTKEAWEQNVMQSSEFKDGKYVATIEVAIDVETLENLLTGIVNPL